ncbi:hypothetical protein AAVH_03533 [Aphelenchoides avenae]|nr:hypothetical protein AAVH_03533 [Aphelenchus avenae]
MKASTLLIAFAVLAFLSATFSSPVLTRGAQHRLQLKHDRPRKAALVDSDGGRYDSQEGAEEGADHDDKDADRDKHDEDGTHGFGQLMARGRRFPSQDGPRNGEHPDFYFDGGYFSGSGYWQGHGHDSHSPPDTVPQPGPEPFDPDEPQPDPEPVDPNEPQPGPEPFDPNEPEGGPYGPTPFPSEDDCIGKRRPCFDGRTRSRVNCRNGYPGPCIGRGAHPERPPQDYYYDRELSTFVLQLSYDYDSEERVKKHAGRRRRNLRGTRRIHH